MVTDKEHDVINNAETEISVWKRPVIRAAAGFAAVFIIGAVLALCLMGGKDDAQKQADTSSGDAAAVGALNVPPEPVYLEGYLSSSELSVPVFDENLELICTLVRGTPVNYEAGTDYYNGFTKIVIGESEGYVESKNVAGNISGAVAEKTVYVRTACNLSGIDGVRPGSLVEKGSTLSVLGYDYLESDGTAHMYCVARSGELGYIRSEYVAPDADSAALAYEEDSTYQVHLGRGDRYGGGDAASLDYYPREKASFKDNIMPDEVKALYLSCSSNVLSSIDEYIEIAAGTEVNAFVVDIIDGAMIGYSSQIMNKYSPTACGYANNTAQEYEAAIIKLKEAGYYVIGRLTVFNDPYFVQDHPECAISDQNGDPLKLNSTYWPSAYNRFAWEYKVSLAVEAVELFGFNEIQLDYARFPDRTYKYDSAGTIDYINTYGETKAQAIQRFLMYACDRIHEAGAYVGVDVFGESANGYVTAYGQYWPAVSNVVDVICGMPYPDHFSADGSWLPWEHPYDTLHVWASSAFERQEETPAPAAVRTWIQAYDALKAPHNTYGAYEVGEEIRGLYDAGITGGFMTWNPSCDTNKYKSIIPAF